MGVFGNLFALNYKFWGIVGDEAMFATVFGLIDTHFLAPKDSFATMQVRAAFTLSSLYNTSSSKFS
jgi:hypothetical protein